MNTLPEMASAAQLGAFLGVPVETLKYWRKRRRGPEFVRVENHVRYPRAAVEKYLAANTQKTGGAA